MKCLLDSMLVLTKQDRLCHVIHATSDPFYQTWLRQLNVIQHCKVCPATTSQHYVTTECGFGDHNDRGLLEGGGTRLFPGEGVATRSGAIA